MRVKPRRKLFQDIVPFPASKSAGELTISGDELYSFEKNPGAIRAQLISSDASKITDTLSIDLMISYDEGETWLNAGSFSELANGVGGVSVLKDNLPSFAPRVRFDAKFNAAGALAAEHGCKVYAELKEGDFNKYVVAQDVVAMPASVDTADVPATKAETTFSLPGTIAAGDSVVVTDGTTTETYDFYDNIGEDYAGGNTLVDVQGVSPDFASLLVTAINTGALVDAVETDGVITLTAATAGEAGNDLTATVNEGVEDPVIYTFDGGADLIDTPESVIIGTVVDPEVDNIEKILVVSTCDSSKTDTVISYNVESSFDGESWWTMLDTAVALDADFVEKEITGKLGSYFRVVATVAEGKALVADHNTKFNLITLYK